MKYRIRTENGEPVIGYNVEKIIDSDTYSVDISIGLESVDGIIPLFSKSITVISNNSMTGFQVDTQRALAVINYLNEINS